MFQHILINHLISIKIFKQCTYHRATSVRRRRKLKFVESEVESTQFGANGAKKVKLSLIRALITCEITHLSSISICTQSEIQS